MLEKTDLSIRMDKQTYKETIHPLKERLSALQHRVKAAGLPVIVLFEGWSAAGKGGILSDVILTLDPRNFTSKSTQPPTQEEMREPFLWRHWRSIPPKGRFALYDRCWYPEVSADRAEGVVSSREAIRRMGAINMFERQLTDDGTLVVKFFLHVSQKEQKKRLKRLAASKLTAWRVNAADLDRHKRYDELYLAYDEMLQRTHTQNAPWHVVPAHSRRAALAMVYTVLVNALEGALATRETVRKPCKNAREQQAGSVTLLPMPPLSEAPLAQRMEQEEYRQRLRDGQKKLADLHNSLYRSKVPLIIAYEGWDAAGKGGNIRRLTAALDPRGYEVFPIASPTPDEKNRQHLWRFWQRLPKNGHIAIFDRTWYGRVLVERVEGFATEEEWCRAYRELNEFEEQLTQWGAVLLKFWLQIDKDEQLHRFEERQNTPEKQWKITEEDWRNREKWAQYDEAINDMLHLTNTDFAPWHIIESQNKKFGRIKTIETTIRAIEASL